MGANASETSQQQQQQLKFIRTMSTSRGDPSLKNTAVAVFFVVCTLVMTTVLFSQIGVSAQGVQCESYPFECCRINYTGLTIPSSKLLLCLSTQQQTNLMLLYLSISIPFFFIKYSISMPRVLINTLARTWREWATTFRSKATWVQRMNQHNTVVLAVGLSC